MLYKKRGILLVIILLVFILLNLNFIFATSVEVSSNTIENHNSLNFISNCRDSLNKIYSYTNNGGTINNLCLNTDSISCNYIDNNGKINYCDTQKLNYLKENTLKEYKEYLDQSDYISQEAALKIYLNNIRRKWQFYGEPFPEENFQIEETNVIKDQIKIITDNRNILVLENLDLPYLVLPCTSSLQNFIVDYRDTTDYSLKSAYICVNSENNYKWVEIPYNPYNPSNSGSFVSQISSEIDKDGDGVIGSADCDPNNPNIHGNFIKYGVPPKIVCGDGEDNTCGLISNEDDGCANDQYSCENNCLWEGNKCDFKEFNDGNSFCCGSNGIDDLGKTIDNENYICLNKEFLGDNTNLPGWQECNQESKWCYLPTNLNTAFKIYSIIKPDTKTYDIISDGHDNWIVCNQENKLENIYNAGLASNNDIKRFYCYEEGNKKKFIECNDAITYDSIRTRNSGDSAYILNLDENNLFYLDSENYGDNSYSLIYKDNLPDFTNYDYLEFYLTFTEINGPTTVNLYVSGKETDYFNGNVLGYVINGATFTKDKIMHIKVPINNWQNVKIIKISSDDAEINVQHLQLVKKESNPICVGTEWLDQLNNPNNEVGNKNACRNLGLEWIEGSGKCCGDKSGEFILPSTFDSTSERDSYACWNSQPVKENQPFGEVKINLTYLSNQWKINYPNIPIVGELTIIKNDGTEEQIPINTILNYMDSPNLINLDRTFNKLNIKEIKVTKEEGGKIYLKSINDQWVLSKRTKKIKSSKLHQGENKIYVFAEVDKINKNYFSEQITEELNFTCFDQTCQIPLKGNPPYIINNAYPDKYDLYYHYNDDEGNEYKILIDTEKTVYNPKGWLEAVNVPLQLVFNEDKFYLCGGSNTGYSDSTSSEAVTIESANVCSVKGTTFCDYTSSWNGKGTPNLIYDNETMVYNKNLDRDDYSAEERNYFSQIIFGRNLLFNSWLGKE